MLGPPVTPGRKPLARTACSGQGAGPTGPSARRSFRRPPSMFAQAPAACMYRSFWRINAGRLAQAARRTRRLGLAGLRRVPCLLPCLLSCLLPCLLPCRARRRIGHGEHADAARPRLHQGLLAAAVCLTGRAVSRCTRGLHGLRRAARRRRRQPLLHGAALVGRLPQPRRPRPRRVREQPVDAPAERAQHRPARLAGSRRGALGRGR